MENEVPTAEQLVPDIEKRKKSIRNFLTGWIKDDYDKLFLIVLMLAFIIRILVYIKTQDQAIWWDAADYLATGKRWGLGLDTIDIWYYRRGLLWPLITSIFFRVGLGEQSIRFFLVLLSTGIVFVTYQLVATMFNKRLALLTSIPVAISWVFLFFTGRPLTNLPATFFFLTALLYFWKGYILKKGKRYFYLFGLFFALACLIRMQYLMFGISFLAIVLVKEKHKFIFNKGLWMSILIFLIIFIPQFILQNQHFGNPIKDLATYYLGVGGSESGEVGVSLAKFSDLFVYFKNLPYILDANSLGYSSLSVISTFYILFIIGFFLFFIDLFLGFDKIFKNQEIQKKFFILFWIISTFLLLGYIAPHLEQRYIMPIIPFLFFIAIYPIYLLIPIVKNKIKLKTKWIVIAVCILLLLLMVPNYKFGFSLIDSKVTSYQEVKFAGEWIRGNSEPDDIVISHSHPQITYYSERSNYPSGLNTRRDDARVRSKEEFIEFVLEEKPKYLIISVFEGHTDWVYAIPQEFPELLTPVKLYGSQKQPILVIYRFDYNEAASNKLRTNINKPIETITKPEIILQNNTTP